MPCPHCTIKKVKFHLCLEWVPHVHTIAGFIPMGSIRFYLKPSRGLVSSGSNLLSIPVASLLMFAIMSLATNSSLSFSVLPLCNDISDGKCQNKVACEKRKHLVSICGRGVPIIQPMQMKWSRFSPMLVLTKESVWNQVLLERGTNPFVV